MQNQCFRIIMHTSIGERHGTMTAEWESGSLEGVMHILGHEEPFCGYVDEEGNCRFEGRIISLMRTIPYAAVGKLNHNTLRLSLHGKDDDFEITGVPYTTN